MKKLLFFMCLLSSMSGMLFSEEKWPYAAERLICDFNGVASSENSIVCYGDYGIITYSSDNGEKWKQLSIGDRYNIKKIRTIGNSFFGVTGCSIIKSTNGGSAWDNIEAAKNNDIISFAASGEVLYILTKSGVVGAGTDLKVDAKKIVELDTACKYSEIETDGENLYVIADSTILLRFNLSSNILDTLRPLESGYCPACNRISGLKIAGAKMYLLMISKYNYRRLICSEDRGSTWEKLTDSIPAEGIYSVIDNRINVLMQDMNSFRASNNLSFSEIETNGNIIRINAGDSLERFITISTYFGFKFTDFIKSGAKEIIAVGLNKLIAISRNEGRNWKLISYVNPVCLLNSEIKSPCFASDSIIYLPDNLSNAIYKTVDGGATWLPQAKTISTIPNTIETIRTCNFRSDGTGVCTVSSGFLVTSNYGDDYTYIKDSVFSESQSGISHSIDLGTSIMYVINKYTKNNKYTQFDFYDRALNKTGESRIDSVQLKKIMITGDSVFYGVGLLRSGYNPDAAPNYYDIIRHVIVKSLDKGRTWERIPVEVPIPIIQLKNGHKIPCIDNTYYNNGRIIISHVFSGVCKLYEYKIDEMKFDSSSIKFNNNNNNPIMIFDGLILTPSDSNRKLFFAKEISGEQNPWNSMNITDILAGWKAWHFDNTTEKDLIEKYYFDNGFVSPNAGFMVAGRTTMIQSANQNVLAKKINIVKLYKPAPVSVIDGARAEAGRVFLYAADPYPIPAGSRVNCRINWNSEYNISEALINVYDIYGKKASTENLQVNKTDTQGGLLRWDCSSAPNGVYLIRVTLAGSSINVPVIVAR